MTTRALIAIREPSLDTDEGPRLLPLNTGRFTNSSQFVGNPESIRAGA